jgi:O-antigen/teichoic acid export membrane protein
MSTTEAPTLVICEESPSSRLTSAGAHGRRPQVEFVRHTVIHTIANLAALACTGALAFVLPRFLSIEDYGYYRLFLLYGSFAGLIHLGFLDGLLIRWAERPKGRIRNEFYSSLAFLALEHVVLLVPLVTALALFSSGIFFRVALATALYAALWNWFTLGQYAIQALKLFQYVSFFIFFPSFLILLAVLALHWFGVVNLTAVIVICLSANLVAALSLSVFVDHVVPGSRYRSRLMWPNGLSHVNLGWSVVLAGLIAGVALSLDRLVLSRGFSIRDFSIYSFAANALALTYNMILSVARVLFPYLSEGISTEARIRAYTTGETALLLIWAIGLSAYFPIVWVVSRWLPAYAESLPLVRILMLVTGLTAGIHILHSTYFRLARQQSRFLVGALIGFFSAALFLAIGARSGRLVHFAWAMVGSAALWWLADEFFIRETLDRNASRIWKTFAKTILCACAFLGCTALTNHTLGALLYVTWLGVIFAIWGRSLLRHVGPPVMNMFLPNADAGTVQ